jgi:predicted GIY-YIG superfamily endonuclease
VVEEVALATVTYVGSTIDLERRLAQHNDGEGAACTRHRLPVSLVWSADFERIHDAFAFEKRVQGLVSRRAARRPSSTTDARIRRER